MRRFIRFGLVSAIGRWLPIPGAAMNGFLGGGEVLSYVAGYVLGFALVAAIHWRHRARRRLRHPGFAFVEAIPTPMLLGILLLVITLHNVVTGPTGLAAQEGREVALVTVGLGLFVACALLYLTRSEIRWSDDTLAARRWPGPDIELAWDDIRQAGISEIFMRVWVIDAQGRTLVIGKATKPSSLADEMAARLGDRFIGIRKPQPAAAE
ncbi:hypothetical protein [uncultured Maricaulis sp.]|uniref:hypothetical protein n=1 Tax=uncultured Maricaulis sp. TaxID=174710 RepID=UPI0025FA5652|nr:hypothetical protein [uncultured Maricaulis sp.]